jgi:hypothetical protein
MQMARTGGKPSLAEAMVNGAVTPLPDLPPRQLVAFSTTDLLVGDKTTHVTASMRRYPEEEVFTG